MSTKTPEKPVIVVISPSGLATAQKIAKATGGELHGFAGRIEDCDTSFSQVGEHLQKLFREGRTIIAVMAAGALVRCLAPLLSDKKNEPPVIAVSVDGANVVPLLGGHRGANQIARFVAEAIGAQAAITTAGDEYFGVALDAPPAGYQLANPRNAKAVMAALLSGQSAALVGHAPWLAGSNIDFVDDAEIRLTVTDLHHVPAKLELLYRSKTLVLGVGCERGTTGEELINLANKVLDEAGLARESIAVIVSIDLKSDEQAVHQLAGYFGVAARFYSAEELLGQTKRLARPSDVVFREIGCYGVAEGAALVAVGADGALVVEKTKSKRATVAIGRALAPIRAEDCGRTQGHLSVVGIGPGSAGWRSPEVSALIENASDLVGYSLYLDLVGELVGDKICHDFGLGDEEKRVRHALELAATGRNVALICSGDAGIYAMATLVFELLDKGDVTPAAKRVSVQVSPGISALQAAAARVGAPLGHDFCTISLSDLLTPYENIKQRVLAAAEADFVIAFYNPVSKRRRSQLAEAKQVLLQHRPASTPVILARNLGRDGENVRIITLEALEIDDVDMMTVVIVGSSQSRVLLRGNSEQYVYTPRGYAAKSGSKIRTDGGEKS